MSDERTVIGWRFKSRGFCFIVAPLLITSPRLRFAVLHFIFVVFPFFVRPFYYCFTCLLSRFFAAPKHTTSMCSGRYLRCRSCSYSRYHIRVRAYICTAAVFECFAGVSFASRMSHVYSVLEYFTQYKNQVIPRCKSRQKLECRAYLFTFWV